MKSLSFILFLTFSFVCSSSEVLIIRAYQEAPFHCSNAVLEVSRKLLLQCETLGMDMKSIKHINCEKTGDDGNYVEYFTAYAEAECF